MAFTTYIIMLVIISTLFTKTYCEENYKHACFENEVPVSNCKCESSTSSQHVSLQELHAEAEARLICTGSNALQTAIQINDPSKENLYFTELIVSNGTIKDISYHDLKHFPQLRCLTISNSETAILKSGAFKEQKFLEFLDLSQNQINALQSSMFEFLTNLKNLSVADNLIHTIDSKTFYKMPSLLYLDLSGNDLKKVDGNWFAGLKSLDVLLLQRNGIKILESNSFQHLVYLQKLDLSYNSLKTISYPTFFRLKNLKYVSIATNEFETLHESTFKGNTLLERVNLTGNSWVCDKRLLLLSEWLKKYEIDKERAFCMAPLDLTPFTIQHGLEILYLEIKIQESPICNASMCNCTIAKDKVVITVDCNGKGLTRLPETLPYKTKVLNLCNNNIKSLNIEQLDVAMWADVSFLHLNSNIIDTMKGLEGTWLLRNLVALHLSYNRLTEIPIHILQQFRGGLLDELYLSGNPWNCDCNTVSFQTWMQDNYKAVRDFEGICCSSNGVYANQQIMSLMKSQLCPQHVQLINYLDVLNGFMALAIILIIMKLSYDYWLQKRTGKLPRFFSLNFK